MRKRKQDPFRKDLRRVTVIHAVFLGVFVFVSWWVGRDRPLKPEETVTFVDMASAGGPPDVTPVDKIPTPPTPPERAEPPPPPTPPEEIKQPEEAKSSDISEPTKKPDKKKPPKKVDRPLAPPQTNAAPHKVEVSTHRVTHTVAPAPGADETRAPARSATRPPSRRYTQEEIRKMINEGLGGSSGSAGVLTGGDSDSAMGWYYSLVKQILYEAWNQPTTISLAAAPVTEVVIRVERSGRITQRKLYRPSGNPVMDQSVMRAINSVDRLRPLPAEAIGPYRDIVIQFELSHN